MEQKFFDEELEQFLKESADQHRMYPSNGVWTNINRQLHSRRRKIALGATLLLVLSGIIWLTNPNSVSENKTGIAPKSTTSAIAESAPNSGKFSEGVNDIIDKLRASNL